MISINPYLNFPGNTEEAFEFYKSIFGGEFQMVQRFKETPAASSVKATEQDKIMHIALPLGNNVLMATDALESMNQKVTAGNNISLSINLDTKEEVDRIFKGLSQDGQAQMPPEDQFWGDYFGMCTDKFSIQWMVSCHRQVSSQ